jgi:hypothetical protein
VTPVELRLPAIKEVVELFENLLSRQVTATRGHRVEVTLERPGVVAVYVDDRMALYAVVLFDVALAAYAGAALALYPTEVAEAAVEIHILSDALAENVAEIMNVMTPLLADSDARHLRLHKVYQADDRLPPDIAGLASTLGRRLDMGLSISGYSSGELSIVFA